MKKKNLFIPILIVIGLASCKKDYTCECVHNAGGVTSTTTIIYENTKKSDAESACSKNNSSLGNLSVTCEIK